MRFSFPTAFSLLSILAVAACDSSSGGSGSGLDGGSGNTPDAGGGSDTDAPVVIDCPTPTAGPTHHKGDVMGDETWAANAGPHILDADVTVRNGAKLTIEPCADVQLAKGAHIEVAYPSTPNTGSLVAEGTASKPITFEGLAGARWASIRAQAPGSVRLAYATLTGGGGGDFEHNATLDMTGDGVMPADDMLFVDHVTINGSMGTGIVLSGGAKFGDGSNALTITGSGSDADPYPLEITEHAIDALPSGTYTGNKVDEILLEQLGNGVAGTGLVVDATLHERGVPYRMGASKSSGFAIGGGAPGSLTTLTIEAGVTMKFQDNGVFDVQHTTNQEPSTAALIVNGTADKPVTFTSVNPGAGAWRGLWFGGVPASTNKIDHAVIENTGADCSCVLVTCSSNVADSEGAVIFTAQPPGPFITNTTFKDGSANAIVLGYDGAAVNFRPTNTFTSIAECIATTPRGAGGLCSMTPLCDGM